MRLEIHPLTNGSIADQTKLLQDTIMQCDLAGGGTLVIMPGVYHIGTLTLCSYLTLELCAGVHLKGSQSISDYGHNGLGCVEAPSFDLCLFYGEDLRDLTITGRGIINGQGDRDAFPPSGDPKNVPARPMMFRLTRSKGIRLSGIQLRNSAAWCCHMVNCEDVIIDDVTIESKINVNNDGLDLDGCQNIRITNCRFDTGDDSICLKSTTPSPCENILVSNCVIRSHTAGIKFGTSSRSGFRNVLVSDCVFQDCQMGTIKLLLVDGGLLENVHFRQLIMDRVEGPIFIRLGRRSLSFDKPIEVVYDLEENLSEGIADGILRNCTFTGIYGEVVTSEKARAGIMVTGVSGNRIGSIRFTDIDLAFPGGGTDDDASRTVGEDERRYPEQFFFGVLPAAAIYLRHVDCVEMNRVAIQFRNNDKRPWLVQEDVGKLRLREISVDGVTINKECL